MLLGHSYKAHFMVCASLRVTYLSTFCAPPLLAYSVVVEGLGAGGSWGCLWPCDFSACVVSCLMGRPTFCRGGGGLLDSVSASMHAVGSGFGFRVCVLVRGAGWGPSWGRAFGHPRVFVSPAFVDRLIVNQNQKRHSPGPRHLGLLIVHQNLKRHSPGPRHLGLLIVLAL